MIRIGLTGGIGSGKTVIAKIFSILGIPVYDADSRAKILMTEPELASKIVAAFGKESYLENGTINKAFLATFFAYPDRVNLLNALVHPAVGKDFEAWCDQNAFAPYIIKEAALLFESGSYSLLDKVITVSSPEELRIQRVLNRDPYRSLGQIRNIIARQLPDAEKIAQADFVINNDEVHLLTLQVLDLHAQFNHLTVDS